MLKHRRKRRKLSEDSSDDEENGGVERVGNHVYFYCDVRATTVLSLVKHMRKINQEGLSSDPPPPVFLHINSGGGDFFAGLAAAEHISSSRCPVVTIVEGQAASAATVMSVVASQRVITPLSFMLIHEISSGFWGKVSDLRQEFENCSKLEDGIVSIYSQHTKIEEAEIREILKTDTYWDSKECLTKGLVDAIGSPWDVSRS